MIDTVVDVVTVDSNSFPVGKRNAGMQTTMMMHVDDDHRTEYDRFRIHFDGRCLMNVDDRDKLLVEQDEATNLTMTKILLTIDVNGDCWRTRDERNWRINSMMLITND